MSNALPSPNSCGSDCPEPVVSQVPGPAGADGTDGDPGIDGLNAFTTTVEAFTQPADGIAVIVTVAVSSWAAPGQVLYVQNGGYYTVTDIPDATHLELTNLGYTGNAAPTTVVASANKVSPGGRKGEDGTTSGGDMLAANNLSDVADVATARSSLGLGTMAVETATNYLSKAGNLAGLASLAASRVSLGLSIGSDVQAYDAFLSAIALLGTAADKLVYVTGLNAAAETDFTAAARTLLDDATIAAMRETLGKILPRYGALGSATAIDHNVATADTAITIEGTRYRIDKVVVENASISLTTATAGLFTAGGGGGTAIANDQALSALTATSKYDDLTLQSVAGTDVFTSGTIYYRVGTPQGAAATANVWIFGWRLD